MWKAQTPPSTSHSTVRCWTSGAATLICPQLSRGSTCSMQGEEKERNLIAGVFVQNGERCVLDPWGRRVPSVTLGLFFPGLHWS